MWRVRRSHIVEDRGASARDLFVVTATARDRHRTAAYGGWFRLMRGCDLPARLSGPKRVTCREAAVLPALAHQPTGSRDMHDPRRMTEKHSRAPRSG